jgi:hypothetical protein
MTAAESVTELDNPYLREALAAITRRKAYDRETSWLFATGDTAGWVERIRREDTGKYSPLYARDRLTSRYAWAIPDIDALDELSAHAPLIEIGAGTGYWAWLLRQRGVDILAYDIEPPTSPEHSNGYHGACLPGYRRVDVVGTTWTEVLPGGPEQAGLHPQRTLFLCWPPYARPMATECLRAYQDAGGKTLVYVGEDAGGCTGDEAFHELLHKDWRPVEEMRIPQWDGIHDALWVYQRRGRRRRKTGEAPQ